MIKRKSFKKVASLTIVGSLIFLGTIIPNEVFARGGGPNIARSHMKNFNRGGNLNSRTKINRSRSRDIKIHRDRDENINSININRNTHVNGRYNGGHYDRHHHHGISTGAAVAIGLAGLAVGTMIGASQLPPFCSMVSVRGISYQSCGSSWYQPQYYRSQLNYVVVNPPYLRIISLIMGDNMTGFLRKSQPRFWWGNSAVF